MSSIISKNVRIDVAR